MLRIGQLAVYALFLTTVSQAAAQDLQISSYVNSSVIGLNQQFELSVELSGSDANSAPQPDVPNLDAFASYVGSGTSTSMELINGRMSVSKTYTHHFIATQAGTFEIPSVSVTYRGKTYTSDPIKVQVQKGRAPSNRRSPATGRRRQSQSEDLSNTLFLKATVDKSRVYQNEAVTITYKIYTAVNVSNYGISQLPNTVGFWTEDFELPKRPRLYDQVVDGRQFKVAEIKKVAIFPQGPGEKTLDPLEIECEVQLRRQRSNRDIFDNFFNDPFFGRTVRRTLRSNPIKIDVLPLPDRGKPVNFSGAVGTYSIAATVDKEQVKTNEAVALKIVISGSGNVKIVPEPQLNLPADFEVYDPKITEKISRNGAAISGSRTFEHVLIPRFPGHQTIKPISFSYFDITSKSYKVLQTAPIDIQVAKGDDQFVSAATVNSKEDVKFIGQDIRFIQMRLPEFERRGIVFYKRAWFFVLLFAPMLLSGMALGYRRHLDKLSGNVAYARNRKANKMAMQRLRKARQFMTRNQQQEFYGEVSNALLGFVGDKFNVAAAGLIADQVDEVLKSSGVGQEVRSAYLGCLHNCDYQRFAASDSNNGEMKAFYEKAKQALITLDREI